MKARSINPSKMKGGGDRLRRSLLNRLRFSTMIVKVHQEWRKTKNGKQELKVNPRLTEPAASKITVVVGFWGLGENKILGEGRGQRGQPGEEETDQQD